MNLSKVAAEQNIPSAKGKNFSLVNVGRFADLLQYELKNPLRDRKTNGKLFLKDHLGLTGMQVSLNLLPAGASMPFYHQHQQNEELYIFTRGKGQIQIDNETFDVEEGTVVRIAPAGERTWRNNSAEDLEYIVIQARENSLAQDTFDDGLPGERPVVWPE